MCIDVIQLLMHHQLFHNYYNHNHLFYYKEGDTIIVAEMFGEKEDFMYKLFDISGRTQDSIDYWGE